MNDPVPKNDPVPEKNRLVSVETLKKHPVIALLIWTVTVALGAGGVVFKTMDHFHGERIQLISDSNEFKLTKTVRELNDRIASLESRLSSIERGVGSDHVINLKQLILTPRDIGRISSSSLYHDDCGFYALRDEQKWLYHKFSGIEFSKYVWGEDHPIFKGVSFSDKAPMHVWRGKDEIEIENELGIKRVMPYVSVHCLPEEAFTRYLNDPAYAGLGLDLHTYLTTQTIKLVEEISKQSKGVNFFIKRVEKRADHNIQYLEAVYRVDGAIVGGKRMEHLLVQQEWITLPHRGKVVQINIGIPFHEPVNRNRYSARVMEWLSDFGLH